MPTSENPLQIARDELAVALVLGSDPGHEEQVMEQISVALRHLDRLTATDRELLELAFRAMDTFGRLEGTWHESEWTSEHFGAMTEEERDALLAAFREWSDRTQGEES